MGKMKRARQKLHAAAQKSKAKQKMAASTEEEMAEDSELMPPPADPTALGARGENLFMDVKISGNLLTQKLPDFDARSTITSKTFRGRNLKKKEKLSLRREAWMQKMDSVKTAKKKAKEKKSKEKTPIVGDLSVIDDALPTLELLLKKSSSDASQPTEKPRSIPKERKRKKQMLDDISLFQQVLHHPLFQKDAASTIQDHLKSKLMAEKEQGMDV